MQIKGQSRKRSFNNGVKRLFRFKILPDNVEGTVTTNVAYCRFIASFQWGKVCRKYRKQKKINNDVINIVLYAFVEYWFYANNHFTKTSFEGSRLYTLQPKSLYHIGHAHIQKPAIQIQTMQPGIHSKWFDGVKIVLFSVFIIYRFHHCIYFFILSDA